MTAKYPEHEKMKAVAEESQAIGEFLDHMREMHGWVLAKVDDEGDLVPVYMTPNEVLAVHFDIDLRVVEEEKRDMIARLRGDT